MSSKTIQKLSNQSGVFLETEKSRNTLNIVSVMGIFCSPKDKFLREYAILKKKKINDICSTIMKKFPLLYHGCSL
jgi:hypothetical protein